VPEHEIPMTKIYTLEQIKRAVETMNFSTEIEQGFVAYSNGQVVVPPVGELIFEDPPGDTHIKYGYIKEDDHYVIKIASGFYQNAKKWGQIDLFGTQGTSILNFLSGK
jgi:ornithine cyclodeaminase